MATRRSPPSSAAMSTPVRIGRESSLDAARVTWRRASVRPSTGRVTVSPVGTGRRGKSPAGWVRTVKCDRPEAMRISSSSASTATAPGSRARTMSVTSRPGATATPSALPLTVVSTVIVRSRSVPGDLKGVPADRQAHATQHRQGAAPAGHGPPGGAQGFDQHIAFASELHRSAFPTSSC